MGCTPARVYPSPIRLESLRTTRRSSHPPQDIREFAQYLFVAYPSVRWCKGDEGAPTHLNSANILTHMNLSTTSGCPSLNIATESGPRTWAVGK